VTLVFDKNIGRKIKNIKILRGQLANRQNKEYKHSFYLRKTGSLVERVFEILFSSYFLINLLKSSCFRKLIRLESDQTGRVSDFKGFKGLEDKI
jgi:hypothetical protein